MDYRRPGFPGVKDDRDGMADLAGCADLGAGASGPAVLHRAGLGARRKGLDDEALREVVRKVVPLNMGALLFSVLGLMMVIMGIFLG